MTWFSFSRKEGFPTQYPPSATPVTVDVLDAGLICSFVILIIAFLISLPSTRLNSNLITYGRVFTSLLIGLFLLISNFGQEWEVGHVKTKVPYKAGSPVEINATIGIRIGFRSVNITLLSETQPDGPLKKEIIDYNERFEWTWQQGRFGFGPFAGKLQREFRAAQYRGAPTPILWIVDYFVIDGEGFRFGRFYRTAGWYCHIAMWGAFACWLLANLLFRSVIRYGAYCLGFCGILQLTANLVWLVVRNPIQFVIPFEDGSITTRFGFHYWLTFVIGIICLLLSGAILFMDYKFDQMLYVIFGIDPLNSYDEVAYLTKEERMLLRPKYSQKRNDLPLIETENNVPEEEEEDTEYVPVYLKRNTVVFKNAPKVIRSNKPKHLMEIGS